MEYYEDIVELNELDNNTLNQDNFLKKVKTLNRGYHDIKRQVLSNKTKKFETIEIGVYSAGLHGSPIRNAETGEYYNYKVGSLDEDLFFKVSCSSGNTEIGPLTLFYDSPMQYAKHQYFFIENEVIKMWQLKKKNRLFYLENV